MRNYMNQQKQGQAAQQGARRPSRPTRWDGVLLIVIGLVGGFLTTGAPAHFWLLTLAVVGTLMWGFGKVCDTIEQRGL